MKSIHKKLYVSYWSSMPFGTPWTFGSIWFLNLCNFVMNKFPTVFFKNGFVFVGLVLKNDFIRIHLEIEYVKDSWITSLQFLDEGAEAKRAELPRPRPIGISVSNEEGKAKPLPSPHPGDGRKNKCLLLPRLKAG